MLRFTRRLDRAVIVMPLLAAAAFAQSPTASDEVKAAFTSNVSIGTVTLDGTYISAEGSLRQQGDAHLVASSDGTYSVMLNKDSGAAGEQRSRTDADIGCSWKDGRGNDHPIAWTNCLIPAWFLPELPVLRSAQAAPEWNLSEQSRDASGVHVNFNYVHVADKKNFRPPPIVAMQVELSPGTLLPSKASFSIHPDNRPNVKISVEVTYEDYRQVNGVSIPFHVRKFVNGTLVLDITISTATIN